MNIILLDWPYTLETPNKIKNVKKVQIKKDYEFIKSLNYKDDMHPLYKELFIKQNGDYIPVKKTKVTKDFNIKDKYYITKIRKYHDSLDEENIMEV